MNLFKRELKTGLKPFLFWTLGLFILIFAGAIKFEGVSAGGENMNELVTSFPRMVQAVIGVVGINIGTFGGYYAVLFHFAIICAAVYGVYLGNNAVSRESIDKTYEFLFTKPRSRCHILCMKLAGGLVYLLLFCILNYAFSMIAVIYLGLTESMSVSIFLFTLAFLLVGFLFFSLSTLSATVASGAEKGARRGNLWVLAAFVIGVICDMFEYSFPLALLSPFQYFMPADLLAHEFHAGFALFSLLLSLFLLACAFWKFEQKDLNAV